MSPADGPRWLRAWDAFRDFITFLFGLACVVGLFAAVIYAMAMSDEAHQKAPAACLARGGQIVTNSSGQFASCIERPAGSSTRETQP